MKSRGDKKWRRRWLAVRRATLDGDPDHPLLTGEAYWRAKFFNLTRD